jgi:hypothetical protein
MDGLVNQLTNGAMTKFLIKNNNGINTISEISIFRLDSWYHIVNLTNETISSEYYPTIDAAVQALIYQNTSEIITIIAVYDGISWKPVYLDDIIWYYRNYE